MGQRECNSGTVGNNLSDSPRASQGAKGPQAQAQQAYSQEQWAEAAGDLE